MAQVIALRSGMSGIFRILASRPVYAFKYVMQYIPVNDQINLVGPLFLTPFRRLKFSGESVRFCCSINKVMTSDLYIS